MGILSQRVPAKLHWPETIRSWLGASTACSGVKGDLDWFKKELQLTSYNANAPCEYDNCCKNTLPSNDPMNFGPTCMWKKNLLTPEQWGAQTVNMHPLFKAFAFLSCWNIECDELHILWLGVAQYLLGSVLWLMTFAGKKRKRSGYSHQDALLDAWAAVENHGSCQFTSMTTKMFVNPQKTHREYPKRKGRGGQVKSLVYPLCHAWASTMRVNNEFDLNVLKCLEALLWMADILGETGRELFLPKDDHIKFVDATQTLLDTYTWLGVECDRKGLLLFSAAPKLHWLWHLAHRSYFLHPRRVACWLDERVMKHMITLALFSTRGVPRHKVPASFMARYRYAVTIDAKGL